MTLFDSLSKIMKKIKTATPLDKLEIAIVRDSIKKGYLNGIIFAKAITNAYNNLSSSGQKEAKEAYIKLQAITNMAINRVIEGKEPFYREEIKILEDIFNKLGFDGKKVAISYVANFNVVFGLAINEELEMLKEREEILIPKKEIKEAKEVAKIKDVKEEKVEKLKQ